MAKEVIIIGASGHGKVIADMVVKSGDRVLGFLDDNEELKEVLGYPVLGHTSQCVNYPTAYFMIGTGNNQVRRRIAEEYPQIKHYTAIHPKAIIAEDVIIGEGTCVMANAIVNASARVGRHCIINTAAIVEHDNVLEDYAHISPGAVLGGTVHIGEGTHIGGGAVVRNNINIAAGCTIGVGAAVVKDIDVSGVYAGVPAKEL